MNDGRQMVSSWLAKDELLVNDGFIDGYCELTHVYTPGTDGSSPIIIFFPMALHDFQTWGARGLAASFVIADC